MKKIITAICLSTLIIITLVGCSSVKEESIKNEKKDNNLVEEEYYYKSENLSKNKGYEFMSENNNKIAFIDSLANNVTIIDKEKNSILVDLNLNEKVQRFGLGDGEIYINPAGKNSSKVYIYNYDGELIKEEKNDIFKEVEYDGKKFKASKSDLKKINRSYYFYKSRQLQKLNLETGLVEKVFNDFNKLEVINGKKAYGLKPGKLNSLIEVDLENSVSKLVFEKEDFFDLMAINKNQGNILGINYDNEIVNINQKGELLEKISLNKKGDELFVGNLKIIKIIGDLNNFYIQVVTPNPEDYSVKNEIYLINKTNGINEFRANQKTLTLYTHKDDYMLKIFSDGFMSNNIDISIDIKSFPELSTNDYMKKINSEILSGNNIDLVLYDELPIRKLIKNGFLADLTSTAESNLYNNILKAISYNDKVYGLPYEVNFSNIYLDDKRKNEMVDKYLKENTYKNYIKLLKNLSNDNLKATRNYSKYDIYEVLIQSSISEIVDLDEKKFNKEKLKKLLNTVNEVSNPKFMDTEMKKDEFIFNGPKGTIALDLQKEGTINELQYKNTLFDDESYKILPIPSENIGSTINGNMIGILEKSKNKKEAISFLKYMTLNKDIQKELINFDSTGLDPEIINERAKNIPGEGQISVVYGKETKYGNRTIEQRIPTKEAYMEYVKQYENISNSTFYYNDLIDLVNTEVKGMYEKDGSIDEMLNKLESKLYIYLNE